MTRRWTLVALLAITLLAAALRYWQLTALPPGYWYDEAHKSLVALEIERGLQSPIYVTDNAGLEAGYFWLLAAVFKLFGPSYYGTRALSALLGTLTIPLTFWSARRVYHSHPQADLIALVSAGLLSFLLWHVHWSRLGLETISVPLFAVAVLGMLAWAWQRETWWAFALAGGVLGLSQYTNPGARVLPLEALGVFLIFGSNDFSRQNQKETGVVAMAARKILKFGLAFLVGALLIYAPLGLFFLQNPEWFLARVAFTSANARAGGLLFYFDNAIKTLLSFNFRGDVLPRHNLSQRPALDVVASLWMWLGVAIMARERSYWRSHLAVLIALIVNLMPMILSDGAPGFGRTLGGTPMLVMLPAVGVAAATAWRPMPRWPRLFISASLALSACFNIADYFIRYPQQPGLFDAFEVGLKTLTRSATQAAGSGVGYLVLNEATIQHPAVRLTRELATGDLRLLNAEAGCFAYPTQTTSETVFATLPQWIPRLQAQYPQAVQTEILHEPEAYQYAALLTIPAGQKSASGLTPALATLGDQFELLAVDTLEDSFAPGATMTLALRWRVLKATTTRYTTLVHLTTPTKPFVAGADGEPCAAWYPTASWHSGEIVEYQMALLLPPDLVPGSYDLAVGMYEPTTGGRLPVSQLSQREPDRAFVKTIVIK